MIDVGVGGLLLVDVGVAVLMITVAGGMINSSGGMGVIGVALAVIDGPGDYRRGPGNERRRRGNYRRGHGNERRGRADTSSRPETADNTKSHPFGHYPSITTALTTVTIMSMAIHRASANVVPVMLNPVAKLSRVAKFGSSSSKPASTSSETAQSTSRPQPADAGRIHTAFKYALAGLSSLGTGTTAQPSTEGQSGGVVFENTRTALSSETTGTVAQSSTDVQSGGVQQASSAYAQVEQQAGQMLDFTA